MTRTLSMAGPLGRAQYGERGFRIDQPLIKGAAADRTFEDRAVGRRKALDIGERSEPAAGNDRHRCRARHLQGGIDVEPLKDAVASDVGVDDGGNPETGLAPRELDGGKGERAGPALDGHRAIARIDADDDTAGKGAAGSAHEIGIAGGRGAENDPRHAGFEPAFQCREIANAAAQLDRDRNRRQDRGNGIAVDRTPGHGAVEINDMEPGEAPIGEGPGLCRGALRIDGCGLHVAAAETDAATTFQVNGRKQDHGRQPRKFPRRPRPSAWLFSGWNWVPAMLSRTTMAVKEPP